MTSAYPQMYEIAKAARNAASATSSPKIRPS